MPAFPVIDKITVKNYGLYGSDEDSEVEIDLRVGLAFVLGANGIGKSTLVNILFRSLTGPFDIPGASDGPLGRASLIPRRLSQTERAFFSRRVNDGARFAMATLEFRLGDTSFVMRRSLRDLKIQELKVDGAPLAAEEEVYQAAVVAASDLGSYADWILILRFVTFLSDSRQALMWDPSAQRQILRPLFLTPERSNSWLTLERNILQLDSARRNLNANLFSRESYLKVQLEKSGAVSEIREKLSRLDERQAAIRTELAPLLDETERAQFEIDRVRVDLLNAEEQYEQARQEYERERTQYIFQAFPHRDAGLRYLLARSLSGEDGEAVIDCPVCGRPLDQGHEAVETAEPAVKLLPGLNATDEHALGIAKRLDSYVERLDALTSEMQSATVELARVRGESAALRREGREIESAVTELELNLPDSEQKRRDAERETMGARRQIAQMDSDLAEKRGEFTTLVNEVTSSIAEHAVAIGSSFMKYANQFLVEQSELNFAPRKERVGQLGYSVAFPHFELSMTGADFASPAARAGEDSVSESQREFIDLAFRMAMVAVAGGGAGTLVLDSPESSLDAVFEPHAAEVLNSFTGSSDSAKLLITSNLTSSRFVPLLATNYRRSAGQAAVALDLLSVGKPTAAVRRYGQEYAEARERVYSEGQLRDIS